MPIFAVIPAYNESQTIAEVLSNTRRFVDGVIVVDDGSTDRTSEISRMHGAHVARHVINRGLGAAIGTGFELAKRLGADTVITLDADGQHDPSEIPKLISAISSGADVVIGSRMFTRTAMPWYRRWANKAGNLVTFFLFGAWVSDSQSGFRALSAYALRQIRIQTNHMEVSSELIAEAKRHKLTLVEVPIKAIYSDYSLSKGQNFMVGLKTLFKLIMRRINQ
jgi:glycosyltransferase involved in cell wall biosynthesis